MASSGGARAPQAPPLGPALIHLGFRFRQGEEDNPIA